MASSDVTICNLALGRLGDERIMTIEEDTPQAHVCRLFFPQTRDEVLRSHRWNFAIRRVLLSALSTPPLFGWRHSFQLPEDCIRVLEVNRCGEATRGGRWQVEGGKLVTNADKARIKYIGHVEDASLMDPLFVEALSCKLAYKMAKSLTASNSIPEKLLQEYETITGPRARQANAFERNVAAHNPAAQSNFVKARRAGGFFLGFDDWDDCECPDDEEELPSPPIPPNPPTLADTLHELLNAHTGEQAMEAFAPKYWTINGPRSAAFALTSDAAEMEATLVFRRENDLVGIIWDSEDSHSHQFQSYSTRKDWRDWTLSFRLILSDSLSPVEDEQTGMTLTFEGRDADGNSQTAFVSVKNYCAPATGRDVEVTLPFSTILGGFNADTDFFKGDLDRMFFGVVAPGYDEGSDAPLAEQVTATVRLEDVRCAGPTLTLNTIVVPAHDLGMSTGYDDSYNFTPQRIVESFWQLGYRGWVNHYCGMSHYYKQVWDAGESRFVVDDTAGILNAACVAWHEDFSKRCKALDYELIQSVSFELFSEVCPFTWTQRDWDDNFAETGYDPPSFLLSPCVTDAMDYITGAMVEFAGIAIDAGLLPKIQIGEPWWWYNPPTGKPCFYDVASRNAFNSDTGLFMSDFGTIDSTLTGSPYDEMKEWLRDKLGDTVLAIRTAVRAEMPTCEVSILFFLPTILDESSGIMSEVNYPQSQYSHPNLDFMQSEVYDWLIFGELEKAKRAFTLPLDELNYPPEAVHYLAGFVPDPDFEPFGDPVEWPPAEDIWANIFRSLEEGSKYNLKAQYIWAHPQVVRDSLVYFGAADFKGFFLGNNLTIIE